MKANWNELVRRNRFWVCFVLVITGLYTLIRPKVGLQIVDDACTGRFARLKKEADKDL
jgi:hypothetical protein